MTEFKVGDKVKLVDNAGSVGTLYNNSFLGKELTVTRISTEQRLDPKFHGVWCNDENGNKESFRPAQLVKVAGTVYENSHYDWDRTVIQEFTHNCRHYVVVVDSDDNCVNLFPVSSLESDGWKIKQDDTELTLAQVAEKFNIPLNKLRIKE